MAASAPQTDPPSLFLHAVTLCTPHNRARARACTHARVLDRAAAAPVSDGWVDGRNGGCVRSERVGCTSSVHSPLDEGENANLDESQRREREGGEGDFSLLFDELIFDDLVFRFFWSSFLSLSVFLSSSSRRTPLMLLARRECSNL